MFKKFILNNSKVCNHLFEDWFNLIYSTNNRTSFASAIKYNTNNIDYKIITLKWLFILVVVLVTLFIIEQKVLQKTEKLLNALKFIQNVDLKNVLISFIYVNVLLVLNLPTLVFASSKSPLVFLIIFCVQPTFWIPVSIFLLFNITTFTNIGLTHKTKINQIFLNDTITLTSFLLRFFSQFIRIALITIVLFLFYEYTAQLTNNTLNEWTIWFSKISNWFIMVITRLTLEWVDVSFVFFVQAGAYFSIVFWLLAFLFLIKLSNVFEN